MISLFTLPFCWYYKADKLLEKDGQRGAGSHSLLWFNFIPRKALWFLDDGIFSIVIPLPQMYTSKWSRLRVFSCFPPQWQRSFHSFLHRWLQWILPSSREVTVFVPFPKQLTLLPHREDRREGSRSGFPSFPQEQWFSSPIPSPTQRPSQVSHPALGLSYKGMVRSMKKIMHILQFLLAATAPKYSINSC